jgi:hypothetical protein
VVSLMGLDMEDLELLPDPKDWVQRALLWELKETMWRNFRSRPHNRESVMAYLKNISAGASRKEAIRGKAGGVGREGR